MVFPANTPAEQKGAQQMMDALRDKLEAAAHGYGYRNGINNAVASTHFVSSQMLSTGDAYLLDGHPLLRDLDILDTWLNAYITATDSTNGIYTFGGPVPCPYCGRAETYQTIKGNAQCVGCGCPR